MPNLSIKDVPEPWAEMLRQRAARNHRSLQGELMAILERAVEEGLPARSDEPGRPRIAGYDPDGHPVVRRGWKTPEQVIEELQQKYPDPIPDQLSSIDIIRQDRDSR
jgi:hypothetical protein